MILVSPGACLPRAHAIAAIAATALLAGCASFSADGGFGAVETAARTHLDKDVRWVRSADDEKLVNERVDEILKAPLSADSAVQLALLNNRGLQASYNELGIAEADLVQAGRLPNPRFTFERLAQSGGLLEIERTLAFNILGIVTMPIAYDIEKRRFEQAQLRAAREVLQLAADTRRAYVAAVASQQALRYAEQVREASEAGAELARRMRQAGSASRLVEARERLFHATVAAQLARARLAASSDRERLARLLGVWGEKLTFQLPDRLPPLPDQPRDLPDVEATGLAQRFDVRMGQREMEGLATSLGLTRATGFINVLEAGYRRNSFTEEPRQTGYEIEISIPIFDFGDAKMVKAEEIYRQAANRLAETAVNARSQIRESYTAYRIAYDLARHFEAEIVPVANAISEENLLLYNGMLIGTFELLADAREQIQNIVASIEAQREFWTAEADLEAAMTAGAETGRRARPRLALPGGGGAGH